MAPHSVQLLPMANKKSWKEDERMLKNDFVKSIGDMKLQDVKRKQILALLDNKAKTARSQLIAYKQ